VEILRTPDERFAHLPGFSFTPHYVDVPVGIPASDAAGSETSSKDPAGTGSSDHIRIHYLDEKPAGSRELPDETVLLMHGEPSWCFLYRKMVPVLLEHGLRVVAPDLVGFGRSDKPSRRTDYTYERHVEWIRSALIDELGLTRMTLFCQDWGGLIGLRLVAAHPDRFARVVAANTGLPTGDRAPTEAFLAWQRFSQEVPEMPIGAIVSAGTKTAPPPEVIAAYDAPFPDESYKEGARQFPLLVPTSPNDPSSSRNREAWTVLERFEKPFLCAFSDSDPITKGADRVFRERIPGSFDQPHVTIEGAGHFLQEDAGEHLGRIVSEFVLSTPSA
jgi:haloalkane dehalogenase